LFFFDDLAQRLKNINKNTNPNINMIIQPNIIIRKYCGLSSQLLKEQNNRHFRSKSQINNTSVPKEIKTIIIKLDNQKEPQSPEENNKNNSIEIKSNHIKEFYDNKSLSENQNKKNMDIRNNDYNTNYISLFIPEPQKKITRN
jgi:hypothetical protein